GGRADGETDDEADQEGQESIHAASVAASSDIVGVPRRGGCQPARRPPRRRVAVMRPDANVSVDDLRYLVAVARAGKLVTAADAMRVDHTTVRRRIDRLETALGVRLIDRGPHGWMLTAVGREVVARSAGLDDVVQAVRAAAAGESDTRVRGTVRVLTPDGFGTVFAAPALARLAAEHPDLQIELVTSTRPLTSHGAGFDVAVTVGAVANSRLATE